MEKRTEEKLREPIYIILIFILIVFIVYLISTDTKQETIYDDGKIIEYQSIISKRNKSIDSLISLNVELDSMLKTISSRKETLKKNINEKKISISNANSDSDYVFIKRYLSAEYEPLF